MSFECTFCAESPLAKLRTMACLSDLIGYSHSRFITHSIHHHHSASSSSPLVCTLPLHQNWGIYLFFWGWRLMLLVHKIKIKFPLQSWIFFSIISVRSQMLRILLASTAWQNLAPNSQIKAIKIPRSRLVSLYRCSSVTLWPALYSSFSCQFRSCSITPSCVDDSLTMDAHN